MAASTRAMISARPRRRQFGPHGGGVGRLRLGGDVDQRGLEPFGIGMAELELAEFLQVVVQQPGMVERRLQDQRLAQRDRGAMAAHAGLAASCWLITT